MQQPQFGPLIRDDGVTFRLWAPAAKRVDLLLDRAMPMARGDGGWYTAHARDAAAGTRYRFRIDDEIDVPDPASAFQPRDVFGPCEVINHGAYPWRAADWRGRPWHETVILETHVGTFTPEGSYRSAIDKLDHLVETGITALELMPLADFAGRRNWGYDGVLWYAPDSAYGRPEDLKALVDAAHERGLMVFLDVVYNHFGPEGNYLGRYAGEFFTDAQTPWGSAIDFRRPEVRAFAIESAVGWLRDYRFDGLRLDAVHAIVEPGKTALLHQLSAAAGELAKSTGRQIHLMLENDDNTVALLDPIEAVPHGKYRAEWNDDYHHAWHVLLTGETHAYYRDYRASPLADIARTLGSGFVYQGEPSEHRGGNPRGEPSASLSPLAFINFIQNHDQIGNRALGDRLTASVEPRAIEAALAITLIAPFVPMLFMGEEWGSTRPFPFFCDFEGGLAEAVRAGRKREFADAYAEHGEAIPDPLAEETMDMARLDWEAGEAGAGAQRLKFVRDLLAVRRREIIPRLPGAKFGTVQANAAGLVSADWQMADGKRLSLIANLSDQDIALAREAGGTPIWGRELTSRLPPWTVSWHIE
ncbi:MAG: malto-oligosyltrehalose trehalohydrolase [Bradyrhizobium sp.]|nr:malto-oligosyltrehalose trehalohydrolase [Bradyrhizobium sp.]